MTLTASNQAWQERAERVLMNNYGPRDLIMVSGEGARCRDGDGKEYLDFLSGIAVNNVGHRHPAVVAAIEGQVQKLLHCSNSFLIEPQVELAEKLIEETKLSKVVFANSGAEATEAAMKIARNRGETTKGPGHSTIIVFEKSFHGRTWGAMSATASPKVRSGFGPLVPGYRFAKLNELDSVEELWDDSVCAVMVETIQGEGGIRPCDGEFLRGLRKLCDERDALLVVDEIQCGMGRSGRAFAYQHGAVKPDLVPIAKGLGGGLPVSAVIASEKAAGVLQPGSHGSTFGGNPVACAAGKAVCDIVFDPVFQEEVGRKGCSWWGYLAEMQKEFADEIVDIRGMGLMIGMELKRPAKEMVSLGRAEGLLFNCTGESTLRFLPPLTVTDDDLEEASQKLRRALEKFFA